MGTTPSLIFTIIGVLILGLAGCSEKADEKPTASAASSMASAKRSATATNRVSMAEVFPGATSNELAHMKACQDAIADGRDVFAMRHARELMDSTNTDVRLQAVEAFGWIGKVAIKELAEMMSDPDEEVSEEALRQWEMAFDEFSGEGAKMQELERAACFVRDQSLFENVMMKLAELEDYNAVKVLCSIITSTNSTPIAVEVARVEYATLADEPFVGAERTEKVVKMLKDQADGIPPKQMERKKQDY